MTHYYHRQTLIQVVWYKLAYLYLLLKITSKTEQGNCAKETNK